MTNRLFLESYGVQELQADEIRETDGGSFLGTLFICFLIGIVIGALLDGNPVGN